MEEAVCPHCRQAMPPTKRGREEETKQATTTLPSNSTISAPPPRQRELLPPFVVNYAPYTGGQLLSVASRQVQACAEQWDRYYKQNTVNGYKDRHYLLREFHELQNELEGIREALRAESGDVERKKISLVEIGCGVGNAIIPIVDAFNDIPVALFKCYGFDISKVAVDLLQEKIQQAPAVLGGGRMTARPHDLADYDLPFSEEFISEPITFGTIIFVLCSVPVPKQQLFVDRVAQLIAPGGFVFVRDYCVGDLAEARFAEGRRFAPLSATGEAPEVGEAALHVKSSTYIRSNGTLSHFFSVESLTKLFLNTGRFRVVQAVEVDRVAENRRAGAVMHRKFVQARFERLHN